MPRINVQFQWSGATPTGHAHVRPLPPTTLRIVITAALLGALHGLCIAPWQSYVGQLVVLGLLARQFASLLPSARRAAWLGFGFGLGWFLVSVSWVYVSMHVYGNMPAVLAALAALLLCAGLALFPAAGFALASWRAPWPTPPWQAALRFAAALTLAELGRGHLLTGFPWAASGYGQLDGPLAGWATVVGVFGVGLIAAMTAAALALNLRALLMRQRAGAAALVLLIVAVAGGKALSDQAWTQPSGEPISVRLIQGNVAQNLKFDPQRVAADLAMHTGLITQAAADLIAIPETAVPISTSRLPATWVEQVQNFANQHAATVFIGLPHDDPQRNLYFNSMLALGPQAAGSPSQSLAQKPRYDKIHLVPFGEYVPPGFRWFVDLMRIPLGDFGLGKPDQPPIVVKDQSVAVNICYEDAFAAEIAARAVSASILLNTSNLAWFGDSLALPQHLLIARMRALENGRPMLRSTNTGVTAIIDHRGQVLQQATPMTQAVVSGSVQGMRGITPYQRVGDWATLALTLGGLALALLNLNRPSPKSSTRTDIIDV